MCILLVTTAHPNYPLILLSNRDEFLHRPTARASFWSPPHSHIFSGRDLARPERGTWLGLTRSGRLAVLTNFRESSSAAAISEKSRGAMVTSFLTSSFPASTSISTSATTTSTPEPSTKEWLHSLLSSGELTGVGGFSLLCGILRPNHNGDKKNCLEELAVISNRTAAGEKGVEDGAHWIAGTKGETHGLSNSLFDNPWPKVKLGKALLENAVEKAVKENVGEGELVERLLAILSHNTLPALESGASYHAQLEALRHSVFIPTFNAATENPPEEPDEALVSQKTSPESKGSPSLLEEHGKEESAYANGVNGTANGETASIQSQWWQDRKYGTQKQTVVLVDKDGRVKYVERTLYDEHARPVREEERDVAEEWTIEGWRE